MSELRLFYPACLMIEKPEITAGDVDLLNRRPRAHDPSGREDFTLLLAIHHAGSRKCVEWEPFFIDQAVGEIISKVACLGTDAALVDWVRHSFCRNGVIASRAEFEAIVRVVQTLRYLCPDLASFALEQVLIATTEQDGPLAVHRKYPKPSIAPDNLVFVNRILTALGSEKTLDVLEAERLFDAQRKRQHSGGAPFDELVSRLTSGGRIAA
ncbi:hypothetical protein E2A64_12740 [Pseudohoeflea suaedae]|uniref:Uncharacterized protein n=1 Tax=Pseudohoeflea suaedae TaxID=877384 RepID=A0A4V3A743_9HYPH|nr:hypothetical protein [Pseudohoeflea suaedae]TDH36152.1 hypothetical protein E2A64_12740 [Pseudohoeflea suaedae]